MMADRDEPPHDVDEERRVEQYLDANHSFAKRWFVQNAQTDVVQEWFRARRPAPESPGATMPNGKLRQENEPPAGGGLQIFKSIQNVLVTDSTAAAEDFARMSLRHHHPNSITSELYNEIMDRVSSPAAARTGVALPDRLKDMPEPDLMMELITDIANVLNVDTLCHKILANISALTGSDRVSLFLAKGTRNHRYLVAKLFDVTPGSVLEDSLISARHNFLRIPPIPFGTGIVGHVAATKERIIIADAYQDARFNRDIDTKTGYRTRSLMCQPITNSNGDVIGVAQCINKLPEGSVFTDKDQEVFARYLTFCGLCLQNAQIFEMSVFESKRYQLLLSLARTIFEDTSNLKTMITKIMVKTKDMLDGDKSRVYILSTSAPGAGLPRDSLDQPLSSSASDTASSRGNNQAIFESVFELDKHHHLNDSGVRPLIVDDDNDISHYYARQAALTRKTFNMDNSSGTFAVLSVPIVNNEKRVLGVAQSIKADSNGFFTDVEISVMEAFSVFCGLGMQSCMMYEEAIKLNARQEIAFEVLAFHAAAGQEETRRLAESPIPSVAQLRLDSFEFDDMSLDDDQTALACVRIFLDLNMLEPFRIPYPVLCRWILSVRKNYRPVIYHNWRHAFNVVQTMYYLIRTCNMHRILEPSEQLALIVSCMCHDLDHRGLNNSFQSKTCHPLTKIYSTSYMENHHLDYTLLLLKSQENNILAEAPGRDQIIRMIGGCILATDLAEYMRKKDRIQELVRTGRMDPNDPGKKELLRGMLMTACDLAAICKPWPIQRRVAELVTDEFYLQGDLEASLNLNPLPMMDRRQKDRLPKEQVSFIKNVCLPLYQILFEFWPETEPLYSGCLDNLQRWQDLAEQPRHRDSEVSAN